MQLRMAISTLVVLSTTGCGTLTTSKHEGSPSWSHDYLAKLEGKWVGTLEYRDYSSDARVTLPTLLEVVYVDGEDSARFDFTYDDGPGKTVWSTETATINELRNTYSIVSEDGNDVSDFIIRSQTGDTLTIEGKQTENDAPVDVRETIRATGTSYSWVKETRASGGVFKFRHEYKFVRAATD